MEVVDHPSLQHQQPQPQHPLMEAPIETQPRTRRSAGCVRNFIKESTRIKLREFILNRSPHLRELYDEPPASQQQQQQQQLHQQAQPTTQPQTATIANLSELEAAIKQLENERRLQYELVMRQFEQELMRQMHENRIKMSDLTRLYEFYLFRSSLNRGGGASAGPLDPSTAQSLINMSRVGAAAAAAGYPQ